MIPVIITFKHMLLLTYSVGKGSSVKSPRVEMGLLHFGRHEDMKGWRGGSGGSSSSGDSVEVIEQFGLIYPS